MLLWGAGRIWVLVRLSSLPVGVDTAYDRGLPQAFLSLRLVSISVSFDPGCLPFVLVLVQEVALRTCHGRIFSAPASPLVWG